jgi:hypothetical protein
MVDYNGQMQFSDFTYRQQFDLEFVKHIQHHSMWSNPDNDSTTRETIIIKTTFNPLSILCAAWKAVLTLNPLVEKITHDP